MGTLILFQHITVDRLADNFGPGASFDLVLGHTHQWCVYVNPYENEDLSMFIKKIQFKLHTSYALNTRTCPKPPYEVKETGWGEFDVEICIYISG